MGGFVSIVSGTGSKVLEEASTATQEIARNVQAAGAASTKVMSKAGEHSRDSERLKAQVASFIAQVRTGGHGSSPGPHRGAT